MYFAVFNPYVKAGISRGKGRWQIRKWLGTYPKRLGLWDTDMSELILTVCREEFSSDQGLFDAGYEELDMRIIHAIRRSNWWKLKWKEEVAKIDYNNEMLERRANQRLEDESKMAAKAIWRNLREPSVDYGARNKY